MPAAQWNAYLKNTRNSGMSRDEQITEYHRLINAGKLNPPKTTFKREQAGMGIEDRREPVIKTEPAIQTPTSKNRKKKREQDVKKEAESPLFTMQDLYDATVVAPVQDPFPSEPTATHEIGE